MTDSKPFQMPPYPKEYEGASVHDEWWDLYQDHAPNVRFTEHNGYIETRRFIRYSWRERLSNILHGEFTSGYWEFDRYYGRR